MPRPGEEGDMNHIRCPHCKKVVRHPDLKDIGKREIRIICPECGRKIVVNK